MAYEIELKARVESREAVKERLSGLGVWGGSYRKDDCYWMSTPDGGSPTVGLRVRRETRVSPDGEASGVCVVTFKTKQKWDGIEINEENEFTVSDGDVFSTLLGRLGFREDYHKHKTGDRWVVDGVTAELAEVGDDRRSLGVFLELEIITDESDPGVVESAGARLFALLAGCGVGKDRIESRYYEELLRS